MSSSFSDFDRRKADSPMPLIGTYVAAASLACSIAITADTYRGFRNRKWWFPCKFFTLNAATLTLLGIAVKLSLDLTGFMPSYWDQQAKLVSNVFVCIAIGNSMPSIGPMGNTEIFMNIAALGILVITDVVNICIEFSTDVIYILLPQQAVVMFCMIFSLLVLSTTALTVSNTKRYLDLKFGEMIEKIVSNEETEEIGPTEKLKIDMRKYWMIAETGNPQFVIARSATSSALGAICLLTVLILVESWLELYLVKPDKQKGVSDYTWSSIVIVVTQSLGVGIGTIAPVCRWLYGVKIKCSGIEDGGKSSEDKFKVEGYWIQKLVEWKERPLAITIRSKKCRKLVHCTEKRLLDFCIRVQIVIVVVSKSVQLFSIFLTRMSLRCCQCFKGFRKKPRSNCPENDSRLGSASRSEANHSFKLDLGPYVLHLEGEEELPQQITRNNANATDGLIRMGKKQRPKHLRQLLSNSTGNKGVAALNVARVLSQNCEEPPNSWALPVVTLTSIALALPKIGNHTVDRLLSSVREGLVYMALVENNLDQGGNLANVRNAADILWLGVDLYCKWLDEDLQKISLEGKTSRENLERLANIAKNIVRESKENMNGGNPIEKPLNWPTKVVAANSMYRISRTLLLELESSQDPDERLFEKLTAMIADTFGACLANLPRTIAMKCFCSAIEKREENVKHAARILGETEEILEMLQRLELSGLGPDQDADILEQKNHSTFVSSSNNGVDSSGSDELKITVE